MALTKSDLVEGISTRLDLSPPEAKELLENLLETMKSTLASGEDLMISMVDPNVKTIFHSI
jgi:integration host factor subunit alpha